MSKFTNKLKSMWSDESAQGATEYILLLAVIVGILMVFGKDIKKAALDKLNEVKGGMDGIKVDG